MKNRILTKSINYELRLVTLHIFNRFIEKQLIEMMKLNAHVLRSSQRVRNVYSKLSIKYI